MVVAKKPAPTDNSDTNSDNNSDNNSENNENKPEFDENKLRELIRQVMSEGNSDKETKPPEEPERSWSLKDLEALAAEAVRKVLPSSNKGEEDKKDDKPAPPETTPEIIPKLRKWIWGE